MKYNITHRFSLFFYLYLSCLSFNSVAQSPDQLWHSWEKVAELPFSMRDGVGAVHFNNEIWMMGGWNYGPLSNEIFKSSDGINWEKVGNGTWQGRHGAGMVAFKDKLWVLSGDGHPDIWSSEDGIDWTLEVDHAPWGRRYAPYVTVFKGKMWLMGGVSYWDESGFYSQSLEKVFNDIWSSEDGIHWTLETANAPWGPRGMIHGSLIHNDELWILGGGSKNWNIPTYIHNDVWKTKDGVNWELVNESAPWAPRIHFTTLSFDGKIWVIDGTTTGESLTNEVWYSEDGLSWHTLNSSTKFPPTHASTAFAHDNSLFISAGYDMDAIYRYKPPQQQLLINNEPITLIANDKRKDVDLLLSSGLTPHIQVQDTSIASITDNNLITARQKGKTRIVISHPGTYGFYPFDTTYLELTVKEEQHIIAEVLPEALLYDTVRIHSISDADLPISLLPNDQIKIISDNTFIPLTPGNLSLKLVQSGSDMYMPWEKTLYIHIFDNNDHTVLRQEQSLIGDQHSITATYGDLPISLPFESTAGLPLSYQIADTTVVSLTKEHLLEIKGSGLTQILVSNAGNDEYFPLLTSAIQVNVERKKQYLIMEEQSISSTYGSAPELLSYVTDSGIPPLFTVADTSVVEVVDENKLVIKNAGTTSLSVYNYGDRNYYPLELTTVPVTVSKKEQEVQVLFPSDLLVNDTLTFDLISDSELPFSIAPNEHLIYLNDSAFIAKAPGTLQLTLQQPGNRNFKPWSKTFELFILGSKELMLFPNPTHGLMTLTISSQVGLIKSMSIYSLEGGLRQKLSPSELASRLKVDVGELEPGAYIMHVALSTGEVKRVKFLKL